MVDVELQDFDKPDLMTGFRARWWHSDGEVVPEKHFINDGNTKNLRRYSNNY